MNTKGKLITALLVVAILVLAISTTVMGVHVWTPDEMNAYITHDSPGSENIARTGGKIVGLIRIVGTTVAVGMITVLGIKYMMGSAEERAEYKKTLFPYFIGAVLIFAATNLVNIIYKWASGL